jgi:hypothetical protein
MTPTIHPAVRIITREERIQRLREEIAIRQDQIWVMEQEIAATRGDAS